MRDVLAELGRKRALAYTTVLTVLKELRTTKPWCKGAWTGCCRS